MNAAEEQEFKDGGYEAIFKAEDQKLAKEAALDAPAKAKWEADASAERTAERTARELKAYEEYQKMMGK
jgi:hypothetical protein